MVPVTASRVNRFQAADYLMLKPQGRGFETREEEPWKGVGPSRGANQFLNMSQSSFSMGVFPMVLRKKSSSIRSEETNFRAGKSNRSFPNLEEWRRGLKGVGFRTRSSAVLDGGLCMGRTVELHQHPRPERHTQQLYIENKNGGLANHLLSPIGFLSYQSSKTLVEGSGCDSCFILTRSPVR